MSGNVFEWCWDGYRVYDSASVQNPTGVTEGTRRVLRGGGWYYDASGSRVSRRDNDTPVDRYYRIGFRLVRSGT